MKMKKLIAIILAALCAFALFSCEPTEPQGETDALDAVLKMYSLSEPTKIVSTQRTILGNVTLEGEEILVTGSIDGKIATVYTYWYEELLTIEEGGGEVIIGIKDVPREGSKEYFEDKGVRVDGGEWTEGYNFAPATGDIALGLTKENAGDYAYSDHSFTCTVKAADTEAVFGRAIDSDVSVTIMDDGAVITGVVISYTIAGDSGDDDVTYPDSQITISTVYTYDFEKVTLVK